MSYRALMRKKLLEEIYDSLSEEDKRTHVSRIEAGKYAVTLETIQAIAEALGMTVDIIDTKLQDLAPLKNMG